MILTRFQKILFALQKVWVTKSITLDTASANVVVWNMILSIITFITESVFVGNFAIGFAHSKVQSRMGYYPKITSILMELIYTQKQTAIMYTWILHIQEKESFSYIAIPAIKDSQVEEIYKTSIVSLVKLFYFKTRFKTLKTLTKKLLYNWKKISHI